MKRSAAGPSLVVLLAAALLGLAAGCGGGGAMVNATQASSGSTITVSSGDTIQLKLPESPSQHLKWVRMTVSKGLTVSGSSFKPGENPGRLQGVEGTRVWTITANSAGTQTIRGVYTNTQRPQDNPQYFSLTVKVK